MKITAAKLLVCMLITTVLFTACNGPLNPLATSAPPVPTSTQTSIPATLTATVVPTPTPVPGPASLTGAIFLEGEVTAPFSSSIQLRSSDDSFTWVAGTETDADGVYGIEDLEGGTYELWVLITSQPAMPPGCSDVAPPDDTWKIGIMFDGDKALSMENAWLSKALLLMENMPPSSDLSAEGFFAVLPGLEVQPGIMNVVDVTLMCK